MTLTSRKENTSGLSSCLSPNLWMSLTFLTIPCWKYGPQNEIIMIHRIGLWDNLQESPIFDGKNHGFL